MDIKAIESALEGASSSGVARISYIIPGKAFSAGKGDDRTSNVEEIELYLTGYPLGERETDDLKESLAMLDPPEKLEDYLDSYRADEGSGIVTFTLRHLTVDYFHSNIINLNNKKNGYLEVPDEDMRPKNSTTEIVTYHREDSGAVHQRNIGKSGFGVSHSRLMHNLSIPAEYIKSIVY